MKVCVHSVISLIISIISAVSFYLLLELSGSIKEVVRVIWYISSALCTVYPIFSKYRRKKGGLSGRRLEITALVIAFWTFQFWLIYAIGTNDIVNWALVITCYIIYSKTSNSIISEKEVQLNTANISNKNFLNGVNADDSNVTKNEEAVLTSEAKSTDIQLDSVPPEKQLISPSPKKAKPSFCKYCGNPIDQATKKCTGCGKQYFRFPTIKKYAVALCAVVLISVASIAFCVYQINQYQQEIADLKEQIADWEYLASNKNARIVEQDRQISALQSDIDFINRHVVFVLDNGSKEYHTYGCYLFKYGRYSFWAYNLEAAKGKGYTPCSLCNK